MQKKRTGWQWEDWLERIWPSRGTLDKATIKELRDRTRACQSYFDRHHFYEPPEGVDVRRIAEVPWEQKHCVRPYVQKRSRNGLVVPPVQDFRARELSATSKRESPTRELTKLAPRHSPGRRKRPLMVRKPAGEVDDDPSYSSFTRIHTSILKYTRSAH